MRIPLFSIRNQRSVAFAECLSVPPLMVIAGPNGSGKSTLLNALRTQSGSGPILYVGPHRHARRQNVQSRHLLTADISLTSLLSRNDTPSYEGIQLISGARDAWSFDDTANYFKHGLCQIEIERQQVIAAMYDREGEIQKGKIQDPWKPLRDLTNNLLPHLSFARIDTSDRTQVRCLWQVHTKATEVDLDDLSSGEKSVVQMFYPLVEKQIKEILAEVRGTHQAEEHREMCVLIDEPELHLHPNLQMKVFDYMRKLAADEAIQFILATHSPTVVEYATFDELFLLRPVELIDIGENQLIHLATDEERLRVLRNMFGTASNVTAMQTVVVVEGVGEQEATKAVADRKLYRALHPGFDKVTLIAGGGKGECIKLRRTLEKALSALSSKVRAFALLDRDLTTTPSAEGVHLLPVAMIENLLLDPHSIWEAIQSVLEKTAFTTIDDIAAAIDTLLDAADQDEIERRALSSLGIAVFRPKPPVTEIALQLEEHIAALQVQYTEAKAAPAIQEGKDVVAKLKSQNQRRELFHGKEIIHQFFRQHLHSTGMQKGIFLFESARHAKGRKAVKQFFDELFDLWGLMPLPAGPISEQPNVEMSGKPAVP